MRRWVENGASDYLLAQDDDRMAGQRWWGVVQGRLLDELTGRPLRTAIRVESDVDQLTPRVAAGALAGLAGIPLQAFHHPDLSLHPHPIDITFHADGYLPQVHHLQLGPLAGFPGRFTPLDLGDIGMHREPVTLRGRVARPDGTPVSGLTVRIESIWRRLPAATASPPPDPSQLLGLHLPLDFPRQAGVARLRRRELIEVVGEDKALMEPAAREQSQIRCSDRVNLAVGDRLAIDTGDPELTEYLAVSDIQGAVSPDAPARIGLAAPLAREHRAGATVRRVTVQPAGPDNLFAVDALAGDGCVLLDGLNGLAGSLFVEILDGVHPNEYRRMRAFATNTDADGCFRLPPLSRVAMLDLRVFGGPLSADIDGFVPDYGRREQWIDLRV